MMNAEELFKKVDHTLLKPEATWEQIQNLCDEAVRFHTASVCINPCYVRQACDYLQGRVPVCTVIGFPLGATTTQAKIAEAQQALADGCSEFDMVINIGRLKMGDIDYVRNEIRALKQAVGEHTLKVIVETCLLTEEEKGVMCDVVCEAGADYIKTSTGFSTGSATPEDIRLFAAHRKNGLKIKAAGGIRTLADAELFLSLGADRLGTSRIVRLIQARQAEAENR